jgi:hypothetical protein
MRRLGRQVDAPDGGCAREGHDDGVRVMRLPGRASDREGRGVRATLLLGAMLACFVTLSASAAAAAPETPVTEQPAEISATAAILRGVLNQGGEGEAGTYEFLYKQSSTECQGGSAAPEPAATAFGVEHEEVGQGVEGLEPGTEYSVCLVAHNGSEEAVGPRVTFKTTRRPEEPANEKAIDVTGTTAVLQAELNSGAPGEPARYEFVYAPSSVSCDAAGSQEVPTPEAESQGHEHEVVEIAVSGLTPHTAYTFCVVTHNEAFEFAEGAPAPFTTLTTAPSVGEAKAVTVGPTFAQVEAEVGADGLATEFWAEYASDASFNAGEWAGATRVPLGGSPLAASSTPVQAVESFSGLSPETGYHVRFVAVNSDGTTPGAASEIRTPSLPEAASSTPDGRVYELVSTTEKGGEPYTPPAPAYGPKSTFNTRKVFQSAADGESIIYAGDPSTVGGTGNIGSGEGNQWIAKRTSDGWVTSDISPPGAESGTAFQAFSENLTTGVLQSSLHPVLAAGAPESDACQALYERNDEAGSYRALFTAADAVSGCGHPLFAGASGGNTHTIFETEAPLTPTAEAATEVPNPTIHLAGHAGGEGVESGEPCTFGCNLYESTPGAALTLVNVLPGPEHRTVPNATFGGYAGSTKNKTNFSNAISTDGSRIFWTDTQEGPEMEHVFVLENGTEVQVSGENPAQYWTATPDGRYAYYTEGEGEASRLWRFDTDSNTRVPITAENAGVEGVMGVNSVGEDQSYLYFVASVALANNANSHNETAQPGQPNIYVIHGGVTRFVATLLPSDNHLIAIPSGPEQYGDWVANVGDRTAEVTPDGAHLVFQTQRSITGYDNNDTANEGIALEVFVYSATSEDIACASCQPTGARPGIAESLEAETKLPISNESDTQMRRWISSDGGRVFFDSRQPLSSPDKNGVPDVYEWESEGEGSCTVQATPRLNRGCVYLLSGGNSEDFSYFVDADASGDNVFFTHRGPLGQVPSLAGKAELYDARVGGGFSETQSACSGSGCVSEAPAAPSSSSPSTMSFSGGGNFPTPPTATTVKKAAPVLTKAAKRAAALKACKKKYSKKKQQREQCEKRVRKKYPANASAKAKRKTTTGRGAKR